MSINHATKTIKLINNCLEKDQGASYRGMLKKVLPHISGSYSENKFPFRNHLGASIIGKECLRDIWYSFLWATLPHFDGRILRLFNRGHMEEGRFIALLLMSGMQVYQQDNNGEQFRIIGAEGHFGGSCDGIGIGVPDVKNSKTLLEFKTHNDKSFKKLERDGVMSSKFEHYVQCQIYMKKMGLESALYLACNKNDDSIYGEIIDLNANLANEYIKSAIILVWKDEPPQRVNESPGWYKCKWCNHYDVCHKNAAPYVSCRSCIYGSPTKNGIWQCNNDTQVNLSKKLQFKACKQYKRLF